MLLLFFWGVSCFHYSFSARKLKSFLWPNYKMHWHTVTTKTKIKFESIFISKSSQLYRASTIIRALIVYRELSQLTLQDALFHSSKFSTLRKLLSKLECRLQSFSIRCIKYTKLMPCAVIDKLYICPNKTKHELLSF